jgi:thioredoxin 2
VPPKRLKHRPKCGRCKNPLSLPREPVGIHSAREFEDLLEGAPVPVVVDFWAPWCGPCRMVASEVEKLAKTDAGRLVVAKVNTEELPELQERYAVRAIPTIISFRSGRESRRAQGAMPERAIRSSLGL